MVLRKILLKNQLHFSPVVPFNQQTDRIVKIDLSSTNRLFTSEIYKDINAFTTFINDYREKTNALYAIGGYGELRNVYSTSTVFDAVTGGKEPRRLHLGTDIWGAARTSVMAPLNGTIHSFANNNKAGDYGATIILRHELDNKVFYTLYGHLSLRSIKDLVEGQTVQQGEAIAEFGISEENGTWPPHLHFQVIEDIGNCFGDYPGVCAFSEKEKYLANCPDGDLILALNRF
ncbi:MAG: peptidoglycan DD-metalloendopeptidase family protein [Chitinophagaceae bacterium]|nr:peptidoglycan DD-metalloendopeptidase family protein [Chitinophagaceae bacterium]